MVCGAGENELDLDIKHSVHIGFDLIEVGDRWAVVAGAANAILHRRPIDSHWIPQGSYLMRTRHNQRRDRWWGCWGAHIAPLQSIIYDRLSNGLSLPNPSSAKKFQRGGEQSQRA